MNFIIFFVVTQLFEMYVSNSIHRENYGLREDYIPFIIGICLMGLLIIILTASLTVCYCIRHHNNDHECKYGKVPLEIVTAVKYDVKKRSSCHDHKDIPLPILKVENYDKSFYFPKRGYLNSDTKTFNRFRRGSVPATLSTLEEGPSYLEDSSRRISLSYNCLTEPLDKRTKDSVVATGNDKLYTDGYESATKTVINQKESDEGLETSTKRFSVYDDQCLMNDEYFAKFGKIYFSIQYDSDARTLTVILHKAQHLIGNRIKGKNRYYVKLRLKKSALQRSISVISLSGILEKPAQKKEKVNIRSGFRSSIQADFCNPVFDETFVFTNVTPVTLTDYILQLVIKEETPKFLDRNRVLGYVDFILKNAELIHKHESIDDIHRDILPIGPVLNKGHAVLSLHYSRELALISASVMELVTGGDDLSAVTMEMYTRSIDNVIHKKKIDLESDLHSAEVLEFPMENCFLNSVCLVVVIFARVRNCSKTPYGRFIVGPIRFTDGPGLTHWAEMTIGNQLSIRSHAIV